MCGFVKQIICSFNYFLYEYYKKMKSAAEQGRAAVGGATVPPATLHYSPEVSICALELHLANNKSTTASLQAACHAQT